LNLARMSACASPGGAMATRRLSAVRAQLAAGASGAQRRRAEEPADDVRSRAVAFLAALVRAQADAVEGEPCPGETAVQLLVSARMAALGCTVHELRYEPAGMVLKDEFAESSAVQAGERTAVVGHLPPASRDGKGGTGRSLIVFAHPDAEPIMPEGAASLWQHSLYGAEVDGGRLYGWGVADDLMGVAAGVCALDVLASRGVKLKGDVLVSSTPSKRNANGVTAVMNELAMAGQADAALYLHPAESGAGLREIKSLASGQLVFKITVQGRLPDTTEPGHAAFAHLAINPIEKALLIRDSLLACARPQPPGIAMPSRTCASRLIVLDLLALLAGLVLVGTLHQAPGTRPLKFTLVSGRCCVALSRWGSTGEACPPPASRRCGWALHECQCQRESTQPHM
jgi:acetylornithine deacetylase/succinyl-diaminopimelate desuccinylase-like protein